MEFTPMSPGLDGWRQEQAQIASMRIYRNRSRSPARLPEEKENALAQVEVEERLTTSRIRALRSFKFALVEYLKGLLRSRWKEGKLSKDAHKIIIKKAVAKVVESFGDNEIPSDRRIDSYLNSSRKKLSKLVQEYAEKYQKP